MKIVSVREGVVPISPSIRNAWIDFSAMDCSIVAVISQIQRPETPGIGFEHKAAFYRVLRELHC